MSERLSSVAHATFAPEIAARSVEELAESSSASSAELEGASSDFLCALGNLLVASPPTLDALRSHPEWLLWLKRAVDEHGQAPETDIETPEAAWNRWVAQSEAFAGSLDEIRAFRRREYLRIAYFDIAGLCSFEQTVGRLSRLADCTISATLRHLWLALNEDAPASLRGRPSPEGFAVFALGKLGGLELNYSSDVDLLLCCRDSDAADELRFFTRLGERLIQALSQRGPEGFLYRVDMRLRPLGESGPLVPTLSSLVNYYESWSEAWERQALIKTRFVAGATDLASRFQDFVARFTFARQLDDASLEEIKRVKHRSEKEYASRGEDAFDLKKGAGGIRDIEFYVQYHQLIAGWRCPDARSSNTLQAIQGLAQTKVLLEGEESQLSLSYRFLRALEHRLQIRSLTPQVTLPDHYRDLDLLARGLGFAGRDVAAGEALRTVLAGHRSRVRNILERIYLTPGYLKLAQREEEFARLLTERTPRERIREILSGYGFQDIEKAWQNIRLIALGPAGRLLPPNERRTFLEFVFPLLEVLRDSIDPDQALHNLESFAAATGNRVSFLRTLASRRPHLARLTNLLALSNRCHQILTHHPEYFDSLARGIHLHEGRSYEEMLQELHGRLGASPRGEAPELVVRRYRQREMVRIAYRDLAGLAHALEVSRELSDLAGACVRIAVDRTRPVARPVADDQIESFHTVALGKLGSRQMHYASDLDLLFLYDTPPEDPTEGSRARVQQGEDQRAEWILEFLSAVTSDGIAYSVDMRLRPEGATGLLARSWEGFLEYARSYMRPWERMALIRSRTVGASRRAAERWTAAVSEIVYEFAWEGEALDAIRQLKRRIEVEKNKESRICLDFKYGKGGIADLEFLVQFLQIHYGKKQMSVRVASVPDALTALHDAGALTASELEDLVGAHRFQRMVENRYQLVEEWTSREVSRESPLLGRLARSMGYRGDSPSSIRKAFVCDWEEHARTVRALVEQYFYG